jgi:hypothetical protein
MRIVSLALLAALAGCGGEDATEVPAGLPTHPGELSALCPEPDVPRDFYEQESADARRQAEALIREVRRNPDGEVTVVSEDAHTGETFRYRRTVRELAREQLRNPGMRGVPCARSVMAELEAAVEGHAARPVEDERVYRYDEIVAALDLRKHGAIYRSPGGCEIDTIYASRNDLEPVLEEKNLTLVTDPARTVGLELYRPSDDCVHELQRGLTALAAR